MIEADKEAQMAEMGGTLLGALAGVGIKPPEEQNPGEKETQASASAAKQ